MYRFGMMLLTVTMTACTQADTAADNSQAKPVACTEEAKQCPDGSFVGRSGPHCEFICPPATPN